MLNVYIFLENNVKTPIIIKKTKHIKRILLSYKMKAHQSNRHSYTEFKYYVIINIVIIYYYKIFYGGVFR